MGKMASRRAPGRRRGKNSATVVSLFTGAMGLDIGFERERFEVAVCVEKDKWAAATIRANRPEVPVIQKDITKVATAEILERAGLGAPPIVVTGGPPCEPFSTAGKRRGLQDIRAAGLDEFIRVIIEAKPDYFVFEEVPGFLRAAKRHISFYERVRKREQDLDPDERLGSAFEEVMGKFGDTGYVLSIDEGNPKASILNAADFGDPQKRLRFILVGCRVGPPVGLPAPTRVRWKNLRMGLRGLEDPNPEYLDFPQRWGRFLPLVPPGGCWRDLPEDLQREALGGAYDADGSGLKGGRTVFLRRLSWKRPAPTLVDRPTTKASCLCHPDEDRPLSIRVYARLQSFPDDWVFEGPLSARYRLVGQATPIKLARAVAKEVRSHRRRLLEVSQEQSAG